MESSMADSVSAIMPRQGNDSLRAIAIPSGPTRTLRTAQFLLTSIRIIGRTVAYGLDAEIQYAATKSQERTFARKPRAIAI
jgi:hypothetical protein